MQEVKPLPERAAVLDVFAQQASRFRQLVQPYAHGGSVEFSAAMQAGENYGTHIGVHNHKVC